MLRSAEAATAAPPAVAARQLGSSASRLNATMRLARAMTLDVLPCPARQRRRDSGMPDTIVKHHFRGLKRAASSRFRGGSAVALPPGIAEMQRQPARQDQHHVEADR